MSRISVIPLALVAAFSVACGRPKTNVDTVEVRGFGDPVYVADTAAGLSIVEAVLDAARGADEAGEATHLETGDDPYVRVTFLAAEDLRGKPVEEAIVRPAEGGIEILARAVRDTAWRRLRAGPEAVDSFLAAVEPAAGVALAPAFRADEAARAAARLAMARLAEEEGLEAEKVVSIEAVEWPDASLGCPEEGKMYAQVVTPGHRVVLEAAGETFDLRTSRAGAARLCRSE